jgi:hypothetical protein
MRISFTDQRLAAHGGLAVWTRFIAEGDCGSSCRRCCRMCPPAHSGFCTSGMIEELERCGLLHIMTAALRTPVRALCRHDDAAWTPTGVPGIEVQEVTHEQGRLIIVLRQRVTAGPNARGYP